MPAGSQASAYDAVLYPARPFVQTHPDRLATLAQLFGIEAPMPKRARVLELGCGAGGNLLPMAAALPDATFVGIDDAGVPIARARAVADELRLRNVRFEQVGIEDDATEPGSVDYVIAHGVYSWVPSAVREALLALCGRVLAPTGVAYVSYNALPGGHLRRMLREALSVRLTGIDDPAQRILGARRFLAVLIAASEADDDLAPTLGRAAREVVDRDDAFLFHDVLADVNEPFAFGDFVADAAAHGLQYLAEAQFSEMQVDAIDPSLHGELHAIDDPLRREQLLDVLKERRFRQTLLCRAECERDVTARPERLAGMAASGALRVTEGDDGRVTFHGPGTARVVSAHPLVVRTLQAVAARWPSPVWIDELGDEPELAQIREILLRCHSANLVRLHVAPPFVATTVPVRPSISPVARMEARDGGPVTTVRHTHDPLPDAATRALVPLLDGTRDRAALLATAPPLGSGDRATALDGALARLVAAGLLAPDA